MRIGIFATMAGRQAGGTETYEKGLISALARREDAHRYVLFTTSQQGADALLPPGRDNFESQVLKPASRVISMTVTLPLAIAKAQLDVFHATFVPPPFPPRKMVYTLHCMSQFVRPDLYPWFMRWRANPLMRIGVTRAAMVLCVSDDVRHLVREYFGIPEERLATVYNGIGENFKPVADSPQLRQQLREQYGIDGPYILFAGKLEARKNISGLIRAFGILKAETGVPHKLVLIGRPNWASKGIFETVRELRLENEVINTGHLSLQALPPLYSGADVFVFPSFFEGFGIPPVEAMACGTPVIVSNNSAMPEVAGGAALLIDPHKLEDIAAQMHRVISEPELRADLRRRGLERARFFTWEAVAARTFEAYERVAAL